MRMLRIGKTTQPDRFNIFQKQWLCHAESVSGCRTLLFRFMRMRETLTMNKKELIAELESLGMRPGRGLGQNFLLDGNLLEWIVRNCGAAAGEKVL